MRTIRVYHGSFWEVPLLPTPEGIAAATFAEEFDTKKSELGAVFFSDRPEIAEFFSDIRTTDPEMQMQVMIVGQMTSDRVFEYTFSAHRPQVDYAGATFRIPEDRAALHEVLSADGYDAFVMRGDYQFDGGEADDIAVLNPGCVQVLGVCMIHDGHRSPVIPANQARDAFLKWASQKVGHSFRSSVEDEDDFSLLSEESRSIGSDFGM